MALSERSYIDKIEIVGEWKSIQVRRADVIERDGVEISRTFHRHILTPNMDVTGESSDVKAVCKALWTATHKKKYKAYLASQSQN